MTGEGGEIRTRREQPAGRQRARAGDNRGPLARVHGLRLSTKAMLLTTALIALVIVAVFVSLSIEIRRETRQLLEELLNRSERQVVSIKEDNLKQLLWVSAQITANPTLRAAVETYRLEPSPDFALLQELLATVGNELDKIWLGLDHDLLFVTDERGQVLAAHSSTPARPQAGQDFSSLPALRQALDPTARVGDRNFGVITVGNQHFLVGSLPIDMQGFVIGTVTLGDRIDNDFLPNLRAFFGGETVVTVGDQAIVSTLPEAAGAELVRALVRPDSPGDSVQIGNEEYVRTSMDLGLDSGGEPVRLFLLRSLTDALRQPDRTLMRTLATQAVVAILIAALLSWLATRRSLRSIEEFVDFMRRVATTGDYSLRFAKPWAEGKGADGETAADPPRAEDGPGSRNELDMLVDGFNRMLSDIEARDRSLKSAHAQLEETVRTLEQKESELRHLQKMEAIGLLAGGVAHDFNNILQVVTGFSDLALRTLDQDHAARDFIEEVLKASQSASMLTRQLLALSSRQVFDPKVINLNRVLGDLEKILRKVVGESIELRLELAADLANVLADPAQIEQILLNLTVNSRDAIEGTGRIDIRTANVAVGSSPERPETTGFEEPYVVIVVRDDGCGIDAETRERMFEPFFTTKKQGKGTGLGLSTVHGIVRQCGGRIQLDSAPGQGAEFRIYLPAVTANLEEDMKEREEGASEGSATILLVEDEPNVRKLVREMLKINGYRVLEADGPVEALELVDKGGERVDLLLTDVMMPKMNGRELRERVDQLSPGMKTLFVSGYADGVIDDVGIVAEGFNFLQKPFTPDALVKKVQQILEKED